MKQVLTLLATAFIFFWVVWYVRFALNPYSNCIDHPNKKLRGSYYLCQPGDFNVRRGVWEKHTDMPFFGTNAPLENDVKNKKHHEDDEAQE